MNDTIDNTQDIIDSRDVINRIEELEAESKDLAEALSEAQSECWEETAPAEAKERLESARKDLQEWMDSANAEELNTLKYLAEQCENEGDWAYGEALVRESYFQEYAQQLAEDIGAIKPKMGWPYTCIDWEQAARDLRTDYTEVDFDGVSYLMRS